MHNNKLKEITIMNNKNDEMKNTKIQKREFNPIKKAVITVSTIMSISLIFTECSSILYNNNENHTRIDTPIKTEASKDAEEKKEYNLYDVHNYMSLLSSKLMNKLMGDYGLDLRNYKNLTVEDYKKIPEPLTNIEIYVLYNIYGQDIDEVEKVVIAMGYNSMKDYFQKENYGLESSWIRKSNQEIYDEYAGR